jgi:cytochrome P450
VTLHSEIDPNDPWLGLNFLDPASRERIRRDPYPLFDNLRRVDPVHRTPIGVWQTARYADVLRVLRDAPVGVRTAAGGLPGWRRISPTGARVSSC